jgi:thymidylate kinase
LYISIEGIEGSGKTSTCLQLEASLSKITNNKIILTHDIDKLQYPGISVYNEWCKQVNLKPDVWALLFTAASIANQNRLGAVLEKMKIGVDVISDRCALSTYASFPDCSFDWLDSLHNSYVYPELIIILDLPAKIAFDRLKIRNDNRRIDYHYLENTRKNYIRAHNYFKNKGRKTEILDVGGAISVQEVSDRIISLLEERGLLRSSN